MEYLLMFQDEEVAKLDIDMHKNAPQLVDKLVPISPELFPFALRYAPDAYKLDETANWLKKRCIPTHRKNFKQLTSVLAGSPLQWVLNSHGISAQDGFWLQKVGEFLKWKDVNCFDRKFDYSIGNLTFDISSPEYIYDTPDLSTGGLLPKTWRMKEDKSLWLIKYGSAPDFDEPYNEVTATKILAKVCTVDFVRYSLIDVQGKICSLCENFMTPDLELVTAAELSRTEYKPEYVTTTMHLKERCRTFRIPGYKQFLDNMFMVDYIIGNMDRNLNNFGFLYDVASGLFIGPAPIYDNGTSFWESDFNMTQDELTIRDKQKARAVVNDMSRHFTPNLKPLEHIDQILFETLGNLYATEELTYIAERLRTRIDLTEKYLARHQVHDRHQNHDIER